MGQKVSILSAYNIFCRYLILKDSYLLYIDKGDESVHSVMLFDREFTVMAGAAETDIKHGLKITNTHRELMVGEQLLAITIVYFQLKCWSDAESEAWRKTIEEMMKSNREWMVPHQFNSSFPMRTNIY